jgi:type IV secretory pathway component VirB8
MCLADPGLVLSSRRIMLLRTFCLRRVIRLVDVIRVTAMLRSQTSVDHFISIVSVRLDEVTVYICH